MCDVLDRAEKRGELIGEKRGELKKAKKIAKNLKTRGFSNNDISDLTDVDIKIVEEWFPQDLIIL